MHRATRLVLAVAALSTWPAARADALDDSIALQMQRRRIPGVSLCVLDGGRIVRERGYGVVERGKATAVTPDTLFEAGSISKSVTALAALVLVDKGRLSLDDDVNAKLTSWKIPDNAFTAERRVTLRMLLGHSAGFGVPAFDGARRDDAIPSLRDVLEGRPPATNAPLRVEAVPGSAWSYSSGAFVVVQQLLVDVAGTSFPDLLARSVLEPLGMTRSTFEQPLPPARQGAAASGHDRDRAVVDGGWRVYPQMAAGGLWTTACDLVRFAAGVQAAVAGDPGSVVPKALAREMVRRQAAPHYGLGVYLDGDDSHLRFVHPGRDAGFDATFIADVDGRRGAAVMLNANDDSRFVGRILRHIGELYGWDGFPRPAHRDENAAPTLGAATLARLAGRYDLGDDDVVVFAAHDGRLFTQTNGLDDEEFLPQSATRFVSMDRDVEVAFDFDAEGEPSAMRWIDRGKETRARRLGR